MSTRLERATVHSQRTTKRGLACWLGFRLTPLFWISLFPALVLAAAPCDSLREVTPKEIQLAREAAPYAALASAVYDSDQPAGQTVGNWKLVPGEDIRNDDTGFHAAVYRDDQGNVTLVFQGTDMTSYQDWKNNVQSAYTMPKQYAEAMLLASRMKAKYGDKLMLAGHSLGGGLAQAASNFTGLDAYTFNPANLSATLQNSYPGGTGKVINIVTGGEILNDANALSDSVLFTSKVGETVVMDYEIPGRPVAPTRPDGWNPIDHAKYEAAYLVYLGKMLKYKVDIHLMDGVTGYLDCLAGQLLPGETALATDGQANPGSNTTATDGPTRPGGGSASTDEAGTGPCREQYDPSLALQVESDYQAALRARDYTRLKALREQKKSQDLWKKRCSGR